MIELEEALTKAEEQEINSLAARLGISWTDAQERINLRKNKYQRPRT